ncbi:MAG: hypothetical protein MnENMB40S_14830 [Rhizobiaceae bacterium MnEN-MB40S]|nr:MAG: hypothetical protein MnENMB40S_14830 [Rhizobiaceae bacterium MnEN-MB40S]
MDATPVKIASLHVYPLKSGAGNRVESARLEPEGLAGDRRMMAIDENGKCITARNIQALLTIACELDGAVATFSAPDFGSVEVATSNLSPLASGANVWGDAVAALDGGEEVAQWLTAILGRPCRLAVKGAETHRPLSLRDGGVVSFADTAPLLLTNQASLDLLNQHLDRPVAMARFRPNMVVAGETAFEEDGWERIRVGEVEFDVAGACDRCIMVTFDPETGATHPDREPLATLRRFRRGENGRIYFGQFLIPRNEGRISCDDTVEVLSRKTPISLRPSSLDPDRRLPF